MSIRVLIAGGTIDCEKIESDSRYVFGNTHIPEILEHGKNEASVETEVVMMKDSLLMTDADRQIICQHCQKVAENKIIITHGTDTMVETAKYIAQNGTGGKTIVLVGAMVPYLSQDKSDALFNVGCAVGAVQALGEGVFITMNGKIFPWNNVRKNRELGKFEEVN